LLDSERRSALKLQRFDIGREAIKIVALLTMTIDHVGAILYPNDLTLRMVGRLSFPLFCYLIVLGLESTRSTTRYFARLLLFAFISQVPYYFAFGYQPLESLNIFFTLSLGVLFLKLLFPLRRRSLLSVFPILLSSVLPFDYGWYGIMLIGCMYLLRTDVISGVLPLILVNTLFLPVAPVQVLSLFSVPIILIHNGGALRIEREINEKSPYLPLIKSLFYIYYPLHLALLYLIK
jgi:hypothetical protein